MKKNTFFYYMRSKIKILIMAGLIATFSVGCGDDDDGKPSIDLDTILALAEKQDNLSSLVAVLEKNPDMMTALGANGNYTIFAPTNDAFQAILDADPKASSLDDISPDLLESILKYHVISAAEWESTELSDEQKIVTIQGAKITVGVSGSTITVNDATVSSADIKAGNGIIHVIDKVLFPIKVQGLVNFVDLAKQNNDLSTLVEVLTKYPDLAQTLSELGNYTLFAPTNEAFATLLETIGEPTLDDVSEGVLKRILQYHVIATGELTSADLNDDQKVATSLSETDSIIIDIDGEDLKINSSKVLTPNIGASNGILHVVDAILVPELEASIVNTVVEPVYFNKNYTTLADAVVKADLLPTLIDKDADFTVFAPNNDAFAKAGITSLDALEKEDLEPILLYHVLGEEVKKDDLPVTGSKIESLGGYFYLSINENGVYINGTSEVTATDIDQDNGVVHVIDKTLMPASKDIVEVAIAAAEATEGAEFGQLVAALTRVEKDKDGANLITLLKSDVPSDARATAGAPFTIFAPTDAAFEALLAVNEDWNSIDDIDIFTLKEVLEYHIITNGRIFSTDLPNLGSNQLSTYNGNKLTLDLASLKLTETDNAEIDADTDAKIIDTDILATNGVIHVVDKVLIPNLLE